jgi:hypothetical protein
MNTHRTLGALTAALLLTSPLLAAADSGGETEREIKVTVQKEDGKTHVEVWEERDGEKTLIREFDTDGEESEEFTLGDARIFVLGDDDDASGINLTLDLDDLDELESEEMPAGLQALLEESRGAYLGVQPQDLNPQLAEYFGVTEEQGVLIAEVIEESPAASAGLKAGDVILSVDDRSVAESDDLVRIMRDHEEGDQVKLQLIRDGKKRQLEATLGERPAMHRGTPRFDEDVTQWLPKHGHGMRVLRSQLGAAAEDQEGLDQELQELREQLQELRRQMEELQKNR